MGGPTGRAYSLCMPDPDPSPAGRANPRTVRVRRDDLTPEPSDEPAGPPKVLFWLRLACLPVALLAAYGVFGASWLILRDEPRWDRAAFLAGCLLVFVAYTLPLWWRRPRWWHWVYSLALLLPGVVPFTNPVSVVLLVFWCRPKTVKYFRSPPDSYAVAPPVADTPPAHAHPPGALFALRWMSAIGCGACLLAMPITLVVHAADPDAGWGVLWWLGGFAGGFGLFVVPLFARTPRPWVWWYGLVLLVLCSLSGYFTLLAVPLLVGWVLTGTRGYYGLSSPRATRAPEAVGARGEEPAV